LTVPAFAAAARRPGARRPPYRPPLFPAGLFKAARSAYSGRAERYALYRFSAVLPESQIRTRPGNLRSLQAIVVMR